MSKIITVTLEIEVPDTATNQDITDWVDVEFCSWNSMNVDNPCIDNSEVIAGTWKLN